MKTHNWKNYKLHVGSNIDNDSTGRITRVPRNNEFLIMVNLFCTAPIKIEWFGRHLKWTKEFIILCIICPGYILVVPFPTQTYGRVKLAHIA